MVRESPHYIFCHFKTIALELLIFEKKVFKLIHPNQNVSYVTAIVEKITLPRFETISAYGVSKIYVPK